MNRSNAEIRASDRQAKFIQDRISKVEDHFGEFCSHIAAYNRKLCKVRNKGDEVAHAVRTYAENESFNPTAKTALLEFAETFSTVQDYRNTEQIVRMEDKVIGPLGTYGTSCKLAKERLRSAFSARDKELRQIKNLDKVKEKNPSNRQQIVMAETELKMASVDASRTSRTLEAEMDSFERKKLEDLKKILMDMVSIEMLFHAKALELYTQCYQSLGDISEEADLEEFRNSLKPPNAQTRLNMVHTHSKTSLNNTANTMQSTTSAGTAGSNRPTPNMSKRAVPIPQQRSKTPEPGSTQQSNNSGRSQVNTEYDDDDDDDEDYEDDDDLEDDDEEEDDEELTRQEYQRRMRKT